jgi:hypothetical protein
MNREPMDQQQRCGADDGKRNERPHQEADLFQRRSGRSFIGHWLAEKDETNRRIKEDRLKSNRLHCHSRDPKMKLSLR